MDWGGDESEMDFPGGCVCVRICDEWLYYGSGRAPKAWLAHCEEPEPTGPTFDEVYDSVVAGRCAPCHTQTISGGLSMANADVAFANLVNQLAQTEACAGRIRVIPGDSFNSVIHGKVSGINLCGSRMPFGGPYLGDADIALIRNWIDNGAQR